MHKIDFGCGESVKQGFDGVDIRPYEGVKYQCEAWKVPQHVEGGTVAEIYSSHLLQYLTIAQTGATLKAWHHLLKEGGVAQIIVPDFTYWSEKMANATPSDPGVMGESLLQECVWNLWGHQREGMEQMWDVAKSGYTFGFLSAMLLNTGFKSIFRVNEDKPWQINILTQKRGKKEQKEQEEHLKELEKRQQSL